MARAPPEGDSQGSSTRCRSWLTPSRKISAKSCAAWTNSVAPRRSTIIRSVGRHAMDTPFQSDEADRLSLRRHAKRYGDLMARPHQGQGWGVRAQFHHVIDIAPTVLEAVGVQMPAMPVGVPQKPIEGVSMVYSFDDPEGAPTRARNISRRSNRAIYNDSLSRATTAAGLGRPAPSRSTTTKWELWLDTPIRTSASWEQPSRPRSPRSFARCRNCSGSKLARNKRLPLDNSKLGNRTRRAEFCP